MVWNTDGMKWKKLSAASRDRCKQGNEEDFLKSELKHRQTETEELMVEPAVVRSD